MEIPIIINIDPAKSYSNQNNVVAGKAAYAKLIQGLKDIGVGENRIQEIIKADAQNKNVIDQTEAAEIYNLLKARQPNTLSASAEFVSDKINIALNGLLIKDFINQYPGLTKLLKSRKFLDQQTTWYDYITNSIEYIVYADLLANIDGSYTLEKNEFNINKNSSNLKLTSDPLIVGSTLVHEIQHKKDYSISPRLFIPTPLGEVRAYLMNIEFFKSMQGSQFLIEAINKKASNQNVTATEDFACRMTLGYLASRALCGLTKYTKDDLLTKITVTSDNIAIPDINIENINQIYSDIQNNSYNFNLWKLSGIMAILTGVTFTPPQSFETILNFYFDAKKINFPNSSRQIFIDYFKECKSLYGLTKNTDLDTNTLKVFNTAFDQQKSRITYVATNYNNILKSGLQQILSGVY